MIIRPDEKAVQSEVERDQQFRRNVGAGIGTAVGVSTALGAGGATSRIIPFLSKMVPVDLAMKGLAKVSPKLGDFLKRGQSMGLNIEEGIQYLRDNIGTKKEPAKDNRSIIEQYSPELHQFLSQQISGGRPPIEAAAIAYHDKRFSGIIQKLTKDHKTPWSQIIEVVYGSGQHGGAVNPKPADQQAQQRPLVDPNKEPGQFPNSGSVASAALRQAGPGQAALMDILNKINQKLGQ